MDTVFVFISTLLTAWYGPLIIIKGYRGQAVSWITFALFALGVAGLVTINYI